MSFDVVQRAQANRRRRFWLLVAGLLAATLALSSAVAFLHGSKRDSPRTPARPAFTTGPPAAAISPAPLVTPGGAEQAAQSPSAWVPPARKVALPPGRDQIEEFPIGFPQTPEGAAAAEVAKDRYSSTLDYQLANSAARIYLAPTLTATADQASTATVQALRAKLGVAASGPALVGVSAVSRPLGVQWKRISATHTEVSVLIQVDYRAPLRSWTELAAATTEWQWMAGAQGRPADWRVVDGRRPDAALAPIGTKEFNDAGWAAIVTETAR